MNVIVSNKQKSILDNANIDAIKDLYGIFHVEDLINNFKNYFFSKMIVDATSIVNFPNSQVLKKLVDGIGAEKLIILLPPKPVPPKEFLALLVSMGIYSFSSNVEDVVKYIQTPNTYDDVKMYVNDTMGSNINNNNLYIDNSVVNNVSSGNKYILGIKNVTSHAGSTTLIYMIKDILEKKYHKNVLAIEIDTNELSYFHANNMISVTASNIDNVIKNYNSDIILVDLNNSNYESICNEVLYLVEPSIIKINKLMANDRKSFSYLNGKKVLLNKSLLSNTDIEIFSHEAKVPIYFNLPPVNDRVNNNSVDALIGKLGMIGNGSKKGFFN